MSKVYSWALATATVGLLALPGFASAAPYDIAPVTTGVTDQLTASLPVLLPIVGGLMALGIAIKLVRRFVKA